MRWWRPGSARRSALPTLVTLGALLMSSCGSLAATPEAVGFFDARGDTASRVGGVYRSPAEAMPQVRYRINGRAPSSVADAYVVGDIVDVQPGRSHRWTFEGEDEVERRHELAFNAEDAQASTVHLVVRIVRSIVGPDVSDGVWRGFGAGKDVTLGLAMGAQVDVPALRESLVGQPVAALLYGSSPVFDYDENLWAILQDGGLLGHVGDDGTVTFREGSTVPLAELERPGGEPIEVTQNEGRYLRAGERPTDPPAPAGPEGTPGPRDVRAPTRPGAAG